MLADLVPWLSVAERGSSGTASGGKTTNSMHDEAEATHLSTEYIDTHISTTEVENSTVQPANPTFSPQPLVLRTSWWDEDDDANELRYGRTQVSQSPLQFPEPEIFDREDPELHLDAGDPDVAYDSKD